MQFDDNTKSRKMVTFTTANLEFVEALRSELESREGIKPSYSRVVNMAIDVLCRELAEHKPVTPERGRPFDTHAAA